MRGCPLASILILGKENGDEEISRLAQDLRKRGHRLELTADIDEAMSLVEGRSVDVVFIDLLTDFLHKEDIRHVVQECGRIKPVSVIACLSEFGLHDYDVSMGFTDFVVQPFRATELHARLQMALWRDGKSKTDDDVIVSGGLRLDLSRYEVHLLGRPIELTFKEFELLRFLATNPEKVYSRETLLNRVWGYDYYGGARTVDVHIRRLRSKIEEADRSFIETVRNVGYRFRVGAG
ncbi:MAG: response regulator transcription factor [Dehalococcoidia bacterium]|nr:response regulator transcription factor [Dehalococcoidia bacterium]